MTPTGNRIEPESANFVACPFCTLQIRESETICPHCHQLLPAAAQKGEPGRPGVPGGRAARFRPAVDDLRARYGKWILAAVPVLAGIAVLFAVYRHWVGYDLRVADNPSLPLHVTAERRGDTLVLQGTVENRGEDVHELSLRSIGVVVETAYRDGRRTKKTVFPRSPYRGEGTLLHGEKGTFEIEIPGRDLKSVSFRSEIVDLGSGRNFVQPFQRRGR